MASYAAVISLKQTILRILNASDHFELYSTTGTALVDAQKELESLQEVLERLDGGSSSSSSERVRVLDGQIRDVAHKLEDELEFLFSDFSLIRRNGPSVPPVYYYDIDEKNLTLDIYPIAEMKKEYMEELSNPTLPEKDDIGADVGRSKSDRMVGLSDEYSRLKQLMIDEKTWSYKALSIVGMAGIGKTILARRIFEDPTISNCFECRAWVTVGLGKQLKEIVQCILDQLHPPGSNGMLGKENEVLLSKLMSKRYLIVVDDIWDRKLWDRLAKLLPKFRTGSRVLITTRLELLSKQVSTGRISMGVEEMGYGYHHIHQIRLSLLDKKESWSLFCQAVFGEKECPHKLEKVGKKIAEKCEGLPLTIVTVAAILLSKADMTTEYWKKVADDKTSSVFREAYDQISKVLIRSYYHLPQHLKPCFLYMGAFPQSYDIPTSKLINLWSAEGFAEIERVYVAIKLLENLVSNNLLMVGQRSYNGNIKTSSLHSAFWQMCIRVAGGNKFLQVLNSYDDGFGESIEGQRRLCVHNNVLFSIKEANNLMESISAAHSLLCTGHYHQYPVPLCWGLRLLRVLDALSVRFYEFPTEVLNLVALRYLALTYHGRLPASISKLWNLQFLIARQHLSIKSSEDSPYLPVQIWNLWKLKHLQIMGSDLPDPNGGNILGHLTTLLDVSPRSCTKEVFENFWNLKKLGIRIELGHDAAALLSCFDNLYCLRYLRSLKCVITNPILTSEVVTPPLALLRHLASNLKKLSLGGFGYGWEQMSQIAALPYLSVLKLQSYAFRGPEWITHALEFRSLSYFLIEDTDLVHWRCSNWCFPSLQRLTIRHCYKLKEIPQLSRHSKLRMIEVVDSNPSVVSWAKQEEKEIKDRIERSDVPDDSGNIDSILRVKEMGSD